MVLIGAYVARSIGAPVPTPSAEVTGVVIAVYGPSAAQVETFSLQTNDGRTVDFRVGRLDLNNGGQPAPHLREHLVSAIPITVQYYVDGGTNVAVHYADAAP